MNPASSTHTHTPAHESNVQRAPAWRSHRFLAWLGRGFAAIGAFTLTFIRGLSLGRWRRTMRSEMLEYFYQVGVKAVPAIAVTAALVGIGLVMQIVYWTGIAGQAERIGEFLVLVLVRQVAPIVTALDAAVRCLWMKSAISLPQDTCRYCAAWASTRTT